MTNSISISRSQQIAKDARIAFEKKFQNTFITTSRSYC